MLLLISAFSERHFNKNILVHNTGLTSYYKFFNMNVVTVKIEPPEYPEPNGSPLNLSTDSNVESHAGDQPVPSEERDKPGYSDSKNFTCLLCDVVCTNRDSLRKHLKECHASKQYSFSSIYNSAVDIAGQASGYMNYRYTCSICRAKFKSFRTYLTHTMSHRGVGSVTSHFDEARMAVLFGAGKQYMHDYFEQEDGYVGNFTCPECKTVFMQRDSYAMHMMMRAMNETCKAGDVSLSVNNNEGEKNKSPNSLRVTSSEDVVSCQENGESNGQRCLEDVTSNVDQDEYLKSVLDKVCSVESTPVKPERHSYVRADEKLCSFCNNSFPDQDSLAMHVMSDHADEMTSSASSKTNNMDKIRADIQHQNTQSYLSWMAVAAAAAQPLSYVCKYCNSSFMSRDSLAMHVLTHAHIEEKLAEISRYPKKRKTELQSPDEVGKRQRVVEAGNGIRISLNKDNAEKSALYDLNKLHCDKCNIKFYAVSEYEWHMNKHAENNTSPDIKDISVERSESQTIDFSKTELKTRDVSSENVSLNVRGRRNSTSTCYLGNDQNAHNALPKRPVSVGVCSGDNVRGSQNKFQTCTKIDVESVTSAENSPPSLETVLSNVRALSSNEQRIIYSVFGKDLSLKVTKASDKVRDNNETNETSTNTDKPKQAVDLVSDQQPKDARQKLSSYNSMPSKNHSEEDGHKLSSASKDAPMCKYCEIVFFNKAIYYLHMGLHNVNNPWQCNVCGKICNDAVDFAAHVIHM